MYSIEYLYRECNLKDHALGIELRSPILLEGEKRRDLILLKIESDNTSDDFFQKNIKGGINTNTGIFPVFVSDREGNPQNPQRVMLNLEEIAEVWKRGK